MTNETTGHARGYIDGFSTGRIYEDFAHGNERFTRSKTVPHHLAIGDHNDRS